MHRREFLAMTAGVLVSRFSGLNAAAFHASRRFIDTPFGRIAFVERGSGPVALFLHGFPLNGFQWRDAVTRLATVRRCIAPDFLALGWTEVAAGQDVGPAAQVSMIVAFMDRLGVDRADVVANDSGGAIAQLLVAHHPDRVRTLLLTNCDTEIDSPPAALLPVIALSKAGTFVDEWLGRWKNDKRLARSRDGIGGMCYTDATHPTDEAIDCYFGPLVASEPRKALVHAYAIALETNPLTGIERLLTTSHIPVRVVWGTADTIFSSANARYLSRVFDRSRGVRRLAAAKLFWPEERPDIIVEEAHRLWHGA
jgi:haloalkane dehalogenase